MMIETNGALLHRENGSWTNAGIDVHLDCNMRILMIAGNSD